MASLVWAWNKLSESGTQLLKRALQQPAARETAPDRGVDDCSSVELDELAIPEFDPRFGADTINW